MGRAGGIGMEANREAQQQALRALDQLNIPYELIRHPAAGTIDEIAAMGIQKYGEIPKKFIFAGSQRPPSFSPCNSQR